LSFPAGFKHACCHVRCCTSVDCCYCLPLFVPQVRQLCVAAASSSSVNAGSQANISQLQRLLDEATSQRDHQSALLTEARDEAAAVLARAARAEAEAERVTAERLQLQQQLQELQQALDNDDAAAAAADARVAIMQVGFAASSCCCSHCKPCWSGVQ